MKNLMVSLKRQGGFTLVELMVVVAIIGLLSAVAIPNFKQYQAKAKISEARLQLSSAYVAEAAFFSDFNLFHNCLSYMGFDPAPQKLSRYFAIGFNGVSGVDSVAFNTAVSSGLLASSCPNSAPTVSSSSSESASTAGAFDAGKGVGSSIAASGDLEGTSLGQQTNSGNMTYVIGAAGVVSGNGTMAKLTINQDKKISVLSNGY